MCSLDHIFVLVFYHNVEAEGGKGDADDNDNDEEEDHNDDLWQVRGAGHMVPISKPSVARAIFQAFINEPSWSCP